MPPIKLDVLDVVDTIQRRMHRSEQLPMVPADTALPLVEDPSCISRSHFACLSSRLAQVAAKASADAIAAPASAHDPMPSATVLRLLTDLWRMADAIAAISAGDAASNGSRDQ